MVAGENFFAHNCRALGAQCGQKDGRFDLRRGDFRRDVDRYKRRGGNLDRQPVACGGGELRAHFFQRAHDSVHGPRREGRIADTFGGNSATGDQPHDQTHACAGIAEIERRIGAFETGRADAGDVVNGIALFNLRAQRAHRLCRRQHIGAFQQAVNFGYAGGGGAQNKRAMRD